MAKCDHMTDDPYDDGIELSVYIWLHYRQFLTKDEREWQYVYHRLRLFLAKLEWKSGMIDVPDAYIDRIERITGVWIDDIMKANLRNPQPYFDAARKRIITEHRDQIVLNRCPTCSKILRTPLATQCFWGCRKKTTT